MENAFTIMHAGIFDDVNIAESVTYTEFDGTSFTLRVSITRNAQFVGEYGQILENRITVRLPLALVNPKIGDQLTIDSHEYIIERLISDNGYVAEVLLR